MKRSILSALACFGLLFTSFNLNAAKGCHFTDVKKFKEHLKTHITYPTTGKDIKEACKKEMPTEFSAEEHACVDSKIKDDAKFKNAKEVAKALGVKL